MPRQISFPVRHVDVFTDKPLSGNPLAVVLNAEDLQSRQMQSIAQEFNLSETTFVLRPTSEEADLRVRIFTPTKEISFAGHPVIGTVFVAVEESLVEVEEPVFVAKLELGVGIRSVEVFSRRKTVEKIVMNQGKPEFFSILDNLGELAGSLRVSVDEITATGMKPQIVSTGLHQLFLPLKTLRATANLNPDLSKVQALEEKFGFYGICAFTLETVNPDTLAHMRYFAPSIGVPEDPAAGSAAGGLGAYLAKWKGLSARTLKSFAVEQGIEMGRESKLYVEVDISEDMPVQVKVGGSVVALMRGELYLKD